MPYVQAAARPKSLATAIAIALTAALALFGMASPVRAVGPDSPGTISLPEPPLGVAVNSVGDRYVALNYSDKVLVYPNGSGESDPARSLVGFGEIGVDEEGNIIDVVARGIAFDSNDRTFVLRSDAKILVYENNSTTPNETMLTGDPNPVNGQEMDDPRGLAFDSSDNLYVANTATNDDSVYVFTPNSSLPDPAKKIDDAVFTDNNPQAVAVNSDGDVYIGGTAAVWVAPAGTNTIDPARTIPSLPDVRGLGFNADDDLYAGNGTTVVVYPAGSPAQATARTLTGIGQVVGLAIAPDLVSDPEGTVYVADNTTREVLRFSPEPVLAVDKADVNYGNVLVDTTKSETIIISNSAGANLLMDATPFAITGANPNRFAVTATNCASAELVRNTDECEVTVTFSPNDRADKTAILEIASSAPGDPYTVPLSGKGIAPVFSSNPPSRFYGNVPVNGPAVTQQFTIANSGDAPLVFSPSAVSIVGAQSAPFAITEDSCSNSAVEPAATCTVTVDFDPTESGARIANLQFVPAAPEVTRSIELRGAGTVPGFAASESSKEFTTTVNSASTEAVFTITSSGNQALVFDQAGVNLGGTDAAQFTKSTDTCSGASVVAGQTCTVGIRFTPDTVGTKNAAVTFTNNAPNSPQSISLRGYSLPTAPAVALSAVRRDFANFTIGSTPTSHTFTVTNTGTAALNIGSTPVTGTDPDAFAVLSGSTCANSSVAVGNSCTVIVQFAPNASGDKSANLRINSDAPNQPHVLPLTGSAISLAAAPGKPTASSGTNGQTAVSWPAPSTDGNRAVTGYRVQISTSPSGGFTNAGGSCATSTTTTTRSCTATGLANGVAYYFKVAAINAVGTSDYSAASSAATPALGIQAQTLSTCTLASKLKKKGGTTLQKGACVTNAGQRVTISVKLKGKGKKTAKVKQSATKIKIKGKGQPLKVTLSLSAPAIPGFTAFSSTLTYKAK